MLARDFLRKSFAEMPHLLRGRAFDAGALERWGALDQERRRLVTDGDAKKAERNAVSAAVGKKKRAGEDASAEQERSRALGEEIAGLDARIAAIEEEFRVIEERLPNVPDASVPDGDGPEQNVLVKTWGEPP